MNRAGAGRFVRSPAGRALSVAVIYLVVCGATIALECRSELDKINRGFYSDTVRPYPFSGILTFPVRNVLGWGVKAYPVDFTKPRFRHIVLTAWPHYAWSSVIESALLALLIYCVLIRRRRRSRAAKGGGRTGS